MKKLIAIILICCMVLPILSASATEEATAQPTIEEILNSYHEKAFAAQTTEENGGVSTYARGGSSQTLEQETVAELTAAGYEAYNVTGDNYEAVENTLNTDLTSLGLDAEGSYVVVVSGEDPASQSNPNTRVIDPPTHEHIGGAGDSQYFDYTYNGNTYLMRYVTVTPTDSAHTRNTVYAPQEVSYLNYFLDNLFTTILVGTIDSFNKNIPFGTLASLFSPPENSVYADISSENFAIHARTKWTIVYIQVWDAVHGFWDTAQCSEYATSTAFCVGFVENPITGLDEPAISLPKYITTYSLCYFDEEARKENAVKGYNQYTIWPDCVGRVDFYICTTDGEILLGSEGHPLFTHHRPTIPYLEDSYVD